MLSLAGGTAWNVLAQDTVTLPFENDGRPLVKYPQKRPLLRLTTCPPQLETPFAVFNAGVLTPNDAFFVRYHRTPVPEAIDAAAFRVTGSTRPWSRRSPISSRRST